MYKQAKKLFHHRIKERLNVKKEEKRRKKEEKYYHRADSNLKPLNKESRALPTK
jgi:hypothetical protein